MLNILNFSLSEFQNEVVKLGLKKFVATQIFDWIFRKHVVDFNKMTNISPNNIAILSKEFSILPFTPIEQKKDKDGTIKFLFQLEDKNIIEWLLSNLNLVLVVVVLPK
ncbi:MAG: hypothetical protein LBQ45_00500 [Mycoplasmataceae bacterium]|jgi:23S rRNA (adenine2503-C2)-methyltransferase|nr:hypothetical protein [Mycoplasmataceae bacterium]